MSDRFDAEEQFHSQDRKASRKQRRHLQETDRSKYKKSDQDREKQKTADIPPDAQHGKVGAITGEGVWVLSPTERYLCSLRGALKKERGEAKNLVVVGDNVLYTPTSDAQGVIWHIEPRTSLLARTDISGKKEQLIAANVDQLFIVVSVVEPPLKPSLIDRYLIAAAKGKLQPIIAINKVDLLSDHLSAKEHYQNFLAAYEPLGIPILSISCKTNTGVEALRSLMHNKTSVISGQSGVGKSSLLNAAFHIDRKIGELASKTSKGAHTTTVAELIALPNGGYCIDTPGIRSFGVWKLERSDVIDHFSDIQTLSCNCRFSNCTHRYEPQCAVLAALKEEALPLMRYESYTALLDEALGELDNRTKRKLQGLDE